jgi:hypothetical protein
MNRQFASSAFQLLQQLAFSDIPTPTRRYLPTAAARICRSYLEHAKPTRDHYAAVVNLLIAIFSAMDKGCISNGLSELSSELVVRVKLLDPTLKAPLLQSAAAIAAQTTTIEFASRGFLDLIVALHAEEVARALHKQVGEVISGKLDGLLTKCTIEALASIATEILAADRVFEALGMAFGIKLPNLASVASQLGPIAGIYQGTGLPGHDNAAFILTKWLSET